MARTVAAAALAAAIGTVPVAHSETAKPAPARGTVTGSLVVDGKAIVLKSATAGPQYGFFTVFLSPAPIVVEPRPPRTTVSQLDETMTTGMTVTLADMAGSAHCVTLIIRDPSLGGRRLVKTGKEACPDGAVTIVEADRIDGTVMSSPAGKEETVSGHRVSFNLRFSAPMVK
jgi:hypothetical protein